MTITNVSTVCKQTPPKNGNKSVRKIKARTRTGVCMCPRGIQFLASGSCLLQASFLFLCDGFSKVCFIPPPLFWNFRLIGLVYVHGLSNCGVCVCVCVCGGGGEKGEEVWGGFACVGVGRCGEGVSRYTDKPNQSYLMLYV